MPMFNFLALNCSDLSKESLEKQDQQIQRFMGVDQNNSSKITHKTELNSGSSNISNKQNSLRIQNNHPSIQKEFATTTLEDIFGADEYDDYGDNDVGLVNNKRKLEHSDSFVKQLGLSIKKSTVNTPKSKPVVPSSITLTTSIHKSHLQSEKERSISNLIDYFEKLSQSSENKKIPRNSDLVDLTGKETDSETPANISTENDKNEEKELPDLYLSSSASEKSKLKYSQSLNSNVSSLETNAVISQEFAIYERSQPIPLDQNVKMIYQQGLKYVDHVQILPGDVYTLEKLNKLKFDDEENIEIVLGSNSQSFESNYEELLKDLLSYVDIIETNSEPHQSILTPDKTNFDSDSEIDSNLIDAQLNSNDPQKLDNLSSSENAVNVEANVLLSFDGIEKENKYTKSSITITKIKPDEKFFIRNYQDENEDENDALFLAAIIDSEQKLKSAKLKTNKFLEVAEVKEHDNSAGFQANKSNGESVSNTTTTVLDDLNNLSTLTMNQCLSLINKSNTTLQNQDIVVKHKSCTTKLSYLNDSPSTTLIIEIEKILMKYLSVFYLNVDQIAKRYPFKELKYQLCKFLLEEHLKKEQNDDDYDQTLKWLWMINFCFIGSDSLFNASSSCFFKIVKEFKSHYEAENHVNEILFAIEKSKAFQSTGINLLNGNSPKINIPKLENLCAYLSEHCKNRRKGEEKYVIIISKIEKSYYKHIKDVIQEETDLKVTIFCSLQFDCEKFYCINRNSAYDCLIINHNIQFYSYLPNFKAAVIVYEPLKFNYLTENGQDQTPRSICDKFNIDYVEFDEYSLESRLNLCLVGNHEFKSTQLIVSPSILTKNELVTFLEGELKIDLIARDYDLIQNQLDLLSEKEQKIRTLCDVDILFDEQCGLILIDFETYKYNNKQDKENRWLLKRIHRCQNSLQILYLVILDLNGEFSLQTTLSDLDKELRKFKKFKISNEFNLLLLNNQDNLKELLANIMKTRIKQRKFFALSYPPLSEKINENELFLISSGFFNSFSAQYILSLIHLKELADTLCSGEFSQRFPLIASEKANLFMKMLC